MDYLVFILLVEALLVLSISLIALLVFSWKKKKKNATEIEALLSQIEENNAPRKEQLVNYLSNQLGMEQQPAVEQVEDFIAAEKRFTQQFLGIQLNQQPVSNFYQHSCEFVDKYLQLLAENTLKDPNNSLELSGDATSEQSEQSESTEESENMESSKQAEEESKGSEVKESEAKENEGKDIGSETLESKSEDIDSSETETGQIPLSEAESKEETNNSEVEEDEFSEEPDWGDAFAETGEEMDESLLQQDSQVADSEK
jgi:hypothetical protein